MFYSYSLEIPANTPEASPVKQDINLTWGVVTRVEVEFPPRCVGLAKVKILYHLHQLWPTNPDKWFYTDGKVISFDEYYELFEVPAIFTLLGYNDDDTYSHTPIIRINILPPIAAMMKYGGLGQYPQFRQIPLEGV